MKAFAQFHKQRVSHLEDPSRPPRLEHNPFCSPLTQAFIFAQ